MKGRGKEGEEGGRGWEREVRSEEGMIKGRGRKWWEGEVRREEG